MSENGFIKSIRRQYHSVICTSILGYRKPKDKSEPFKPILTIADSGNRSSIEISERLLAKLGYPACPDPKVEQAAGSLFTVYTGEFLKNAFDRIQHLRPGKWEFITSQGSIGIAQYDQYRHLSLLKNLVKENREIQAALGADYIVKPDIVIARRPEPDDEINKNAHLVDSSSRISDATPLREGNRAGSILHASISCKWTIRTDRAQNTRTEALNLIRNRKGNVPHIVAVTFEPLPTRLSSIAQGTGDLDCTYHGALYELIEATKESGREDQLDMLEILVEGRRLRDISDLPFDLAV